MKQIFTCSRLFTVTVIIYLMPVRALAMGRSDEIVLATEAWPHHVAFTHSTFATQRNLQESSDLPWKEVILACILVNLITLTGVVFLVPALVKKIKCNFMKNDVDSTSLVDLERETESTCGDEEDRVGNEQQNTVTSSSKSHAGSNRTIQLLVPSFSCGALLAVSVFLVIPEAINLITESEVHKHESEVTGSESDEEHSSHEEPGSEVAWRFGAALLGGFMLPLFLEILFPPASTKKGHGDQNSESPKTVNYALCLSILIGDALHNFCDGVFLSISFQYCDATLSWTLFAVTIYHEVAQELSDYFVLTYHAGLRPLYALFWNFVVGLSVLLGGIIVLLVEIKAGILGPMLAAASGVYIHIAVGECLPRAESSIKSRWDRALSALLFMLGVVPVGLVLLKHQHCHLG